MKVGNIESVLAHACKESGVPVNRCVIDTVFAVLFGANAAELERVCKIAKEEAPFGVKIRVMRGEDYCKALEEQIYNGKVLP